MDFDAADGTHDSSQDGRAPRRRGVRPVVAALVVAALVVPAAALTLRAVPVDGARVADDHADDVVTQLAADLNDVHDSSGAALDAVRLAAYVPDAAPSRTAADGVTYAVAPFRWSDDGATSVDVSVRVDVPGAATTGLLGRARTSGSSTSCWRLTVRPGQELADREEQDCDDDGATQTVVSLGSEPNPVSSFGPFDDAAVLRALSSLQDGMRAEDAEVVLSGEFVAPLTVVVERVGRDLVAAVGTPGAADCVVGVRPDGAPVWQLSGLDPADLEPGATGCLPELYTGRS